MLPHSWNRLLRERDDAPQEPRLSLRILSMAGTSLELGGAVTFGSPILSYDQTSSPYIHEKELNT